jgi:cytochrome c biogenesis protein CcmG/thiol:disulfide interchange protein DsbE
MRSTMRNKYLALILACGVGALAALGGCQGAPKSSATGAQSASNAAPEEENVKLPGLDGMDTSLDQLKGKVVLVNFWATWCQPCKIEIPWLIEFDQKYGPQGLVIVGVAMDDSGKKAVEPFVKKQVFQVNGKPGSMDYKIVLGSDDIADKFGGILGLPTSMLYARDGHKVKTIVGLADYPDVKKAIEGQL